MWVRRDMVESHTVTLNRKHMLLTDLTEEKATYLTELQWEGEPGPFTSSHQQGMKRRLGA